MMRTNFLTETSQLQVLTIDPAQTHLVDLESNLEEDRNRNQPRQSGTPNNSRGPEIILRNHNNTNSLTLSQNTTLAEGINNINEQIETSEGYTSIQEESIPEAEIYTSKVLALLLSSVLFSFWSILAIEMNWEVLSIYGVIGVYPIIYVVIDLCMTYRLLKDLWIEAGDHFKMFDAASFLFALLIILLKLVQIIDSSTVAILSFFLIALAYLFSPKKKVSLILCRWFYTLQCLLITLRLDLNVHGQHIHVKLHKDEPHLHIKFTWELILIPSWIYFVCLIVNCSRSLFYLIKRISTMNSAQNRNFTTSQKSGIIWFSCYYGLPLVYFIYLIGAVQALNAGTYTQLLRIMTYLALGINVILSIYTLLNAEKLIIFITSYQLIESHLARVYTENLTPEKVVSLQREMKTSYFVKVSPTYFKPLHNHFLTGGQYLKEIVSRSRASSSYSHRSLKSNMLEMNYLTQGKEEFDQKINNIKLLVNYANKLNGANRSRAFSMDNHTKSNHSKEKLNDKELNTTAIKIKEFIQEENDKDELKMLNDQTSMPRAGAGAGAGEEEKTCYLCYENPADAILISCGHGGICYECASNLVKKTNRCMQCRGSVGAIYKIDPNPILDDIIKGVEFTKIELSE